MAYFKHDIEILFKDYNKSVVSWLTDNLKLPFYDSNKNTKIFFSTPDVAWTNIENELINGSYPAPIGSLYLVNSTMNEMFTPGGFGYRKILIKNKDGSPKRFPDGNYYWFYEYTPTSYELTYNFTCWANYKRDLNYLFSVLLKKTTKRRPAAWKLHGHWITLKNNTMLNDESDYEPQLGQNRILRWSIDLIVDNALLPGPYKFVPAIKELSAPISLE